MDSRAKLSQVANIVWLVGLAAKGDQSDLVTGCCQVLQNVVTPDLGASIYRVGHDLREKQDTHDI
jgi:hypothetical protein